MDSLELTPGFEHEILKKILQTQKDLIEKLKLKSIFLNEDYKLFLNKFHNVKTFWTLYGPSDLKSINVNKNVTMLVLYGGFSGSDVQFLSIFPNLTEISFHRKILFETLCCLPNVCNNLTSLLLFSISPGNYRNLKFSASKKFHLDFFEGGNDWSDFVISNPIARVN